jgi:hypothetical protein
MTANPQFGPHPDAEQLSAFTEHALPEPERNRVLSHLAACGRCRQIIALAVNADEQAASYALVAAAAAPSAGPSPKKLPPNPWWSRWRFVWIPAAVAAAFTATWVSIDLHRAEQAGARIELAKQIAPDAVRPAAPSPSEQRETTTPAPAQNRAQRAASQPHIEEERQQSTGKSSAKPQPRFDSMAVTNGAVALKAFTGRDTSQLALPQPPAAPPPAPSTVTETVTVNSDRPAPETVTAQQFISVQPGPVQSFAPSAKAGTAHLATFAPRPAASPAAAEQQTESRKKLAELNHEIDTAESDGHLSTESGNLQRENAGISQSISGGSAAGYSDTPSSRPAATFGPIQGFSNAAGLAAVPLRLPSGLAVTSIASIGKLLIAIDKTGAVFLTQNSGVTWQPVAHQWTGRAVRVRTHNLADRRAIAEPFASTASKPSAEPSDAVAGSEVFEVVNEKNQVWQSADGLAWQAR